MATGMVQYTTIDPKQERPKTRPAEAGDYTLTIADMGKPGLHGWSKPSDPKKFPSRKLSLAIEGTEDELDHAKPKTMNHWLSASPKAVSMIWDFARAYGYAEELKIPVVSNPRDPNVRLVLVEIDKVVEWIVENSRSARAELNQVKGNTGGVFNNVVNWYPAEEFQSDEENGEEGAEGAEEAATEDPEAEATPAKGKAAAKKQAGKKK